MKTNVSIIFKPEVIEQIESNGGGAHLVNDQLTMLDVAGISLLDNSSLVIYTSKRPDGAPEKARYIFPKHVYNRAKITEVE